MMECIIRPMVVGDVEPVAAVSREALGGTWGPEDFRSEIERPESLCLVAESERGEVRGFSVSRQFEPSDPELLLIAVATVRRREGWGRRLLERTLAMLVVRGARRVHLTVREGNVPALRLYRRHGFEVVRRSARAYGDPPEDGVVMMWRAEEHGEGEDVGAPSLDGGGGASPVGPAGGGSGRSG